MLLRELTATLSDVSVKDAVVFHDELNPLLWGDNQQMLPNIRKGLLEIAKDFADFIGVDLDVQDVTVSGSNAAYTYTKHSDVDLHIVARVPEGHPELTELFDAKKNQYNITRDIKVKGIDVELYVQPSDQAHHSQGIYSLLKNKWVSVPKKEKVDINSDDVKQKYNNYKDEIRGVIDSSDINVVSEIWNDIKRMRKAGLESNGEFSTENIVFKILRNQGLLEKLKNKIDDLKSQELSIETHESFGDSDEDYRIRRIGRN